MAHRASQTLAGHGGGDRVALADLLQRVWAELLRVGGGGAAGIGGLRQAQIEVAFGAELLEAGRQLAGQAGDVVRPDLERQHARTAGLRLRPCISVKRS